MNHIVSSCANCPMYNTDSEWEPICNHPIFNERELIIETNDLEQPITPINCPLKKENLTIVFDDKN